MKTLFTVTKTDSSFTAPRGNSLGPLPGNQPWVSFKRHHRGYRSYLDATNVDIASQLRSFASRLQLIIFEPELQTAIAIQESRT